MKIWRNDKRVIKVPKYTYCQDCALVNKEYDRYFGCLAVLCGIHNPTQICSCGYKYEIDV